MLSHLLKINIELLWSSELSEMIPEEENKVQIYLENLKSGQVKVHIRAVNYDQFKRSGNLEYEKVLEVSLPSPCKFHIN